MKRYIVIGCLASIALLGCNKINDVPTQRRIESIAVKTESDTKVSLTGNSFSWDDGDVIAVWTGTEATVGSYQNCAVSSGQIEVLLEGEETRKNYSVYPNTVVDDSYFGQNDLRVTLPSSYSLSQVSGTKTPLPMIAKNTTGSVLTFYNVAGLVRITVNNVFANTSYIKVAFGGKKVSGSFTVAAPDTNSPYVITENDEYNDVITINNLGISSVTDGLVINIPLPTGAYESVTVSTYDSSDNLLLTQTKDFNYTAARAHGKAITVSLAAFSIAEHSIVAIAKGNLQATTADSGANWTWHFAENQYDYIGNTGGNKQISGNGTTSVASCTVDTFGWSTESTYYGINKSKTTSAYSGTFVDWGRLQIDSHPANTWRTPTIEGEESGEWYYLLFVRSASNLNYTSNARFAKGKVNDVTGIILFPNEYTHPTGVSLPDRINDNTSGYGYNNYTINEWRLMEEHGCAFLPAAGARSGNTVSNIGVNGTYWSCTPYSSTIANLLFFYKTNVEMGGNDLYYGNSVRLVRDIH